MLHEFAVATRTLVKWPGYSASVILTLALGLGASTMMFSLVDAALLRPLPFHQPDRLVMLTGVAGPERTPRGASFPEVADWRGLNATLGDVAVYDDTSLNLRIGTEAVRVEAEMVSEPFFRLLGTSAALGRTFLPEEDSVPDRNAVAVISNRFWRERFGADPAVLQRNVYLNDRPFQIVGVTPAGFAGLTFDTDVWFPSMMVSLTSAPSVVTSRGNRWLLALGRLKDGVALGRAQEDLTRVAAILEEQHPDTNRGRGVNVEYLQESLLGGTGRGVITLFAAVLLFLIVACANAAGLQFARATARRRELAVRLALGARRSHIFRQLIIESFVLAIVAGALGAIGAAWATSAAIAWMPAGALPAHVQPALDPRTLAFAVAVSCLVSVLVALVPGAAAWGGNPVDGLKEGGRSAGPGLGSLRRLTTQQLLVVTEIAAAMILLAVAGLLVRSLQRQMDVSLGFDPRGVTVARLTLPAARFPPAERIAFVQRLEERLRQLPGVRSVATGSNLPLTGISSAAILLPDIAPTPDSTLRYYSHFVTPDYFATLGIAMVGGRTFTWQDQQGSPLVAIVNEGAARRIWGTDDAVGHRFRLGRAEGPVVEVVGVAVNARFRDLTTDLSAPTVEPDVYFPFSQRTDRDLEIAIRAGNAVSPMLSAMQQAVSQLDAGLPLYRVQHLVDAVSQQTSTARFVSALLTLFSVGALLLAAVGLYGLVAYVVGLSRREIAIRLALGADRARVVALIVRNGMTLVVVGVLLGVVGALAVGRAMRAQLFQTGSGDPATLGLVATLLLLVTLIASLLPTARAVRANPHAALRGD
jgi:putative ABC transport system permease protein